MCIQLRRNSLLHRDSVCIFPISSDRTGIFLTRFDTSDPSFIRCILTLSYLKFKATTHLPIAVIHYYILLANILTLYVFETYNGDSF